jgi:hypothetical protein
MLKKLRASIAVMTLSLASTAYAIPTLQIGAPAADSSEGIYANYQKSTTNPTEDDTAITSGNTLYVAGVYGPNTLLLGGQYSPGGDDWSDFKKSPYPINFDGHGAILLAAVPQGTGSSLTINGALPFFSSSTLDGFFPNNHDPLKDNIADFLFYDIGNFANTSKAVPNFADETGAADGEIKTPTIAGATGLNWIHFDVLALETTQNGKTIKTSLANNPGSHDVTWKNGGGGIPQQVPEPGMLVLFGTGLLGLGLIGHRRRKH